MGSVIDNARTKKKCQIFTPKSIVTKMLNVAGYRKNVIGKRVLENSCGNGQFLTQIVERYIRDAICKNFSCDDIRSGLEQDIVAYEIDEALIYTCKERLNKIASRYNVMNVSWNIHCCNFLTKDDGESYDYIIGNPPYIAYPDLPEVDRREIRKTFLTCKKGKFDYSYAFIEKSLSLLAPKGKLVYIIPSNIFKNVFAEELRKLLKEDLKIIIDFPQDRIFDGVLVSPAVILTQKGNKTDGLRYTKVVGKEQKTTTISKEKLAGKWIFESIETEGKRLGDYFKVSNSIATLCNKVFVLKDGAFDGDFYCVGNDRIERTLLKETTGPKSSRYADGKKEYIIFPYYYDDSGKLCHYTEKEMRKKFPYAIKYLSKHKTKLKNRDADQLAKWYEYGRSQGLRDIGRKTIMISSVISDDTKAYQLEENVIPYSGFCITPTGQISLETLLTELNSKKFKKYISRVGVSVSGSSKRITTKDIENYVFKVQ